MKINKTDETKHFVCIPYKFCVCCGKSGRLTLFDFEYQQESSIAQLSALTFTGIDIILGYALAKKFIVQALFCLKCGKRIEKSEFIGQICQLIFVLLIFLTIVLSITVDSFFGFEASLYTFGMGIISTIGFRIWCRYYNWKYFPKIKSIDEKLIVIKIPGKGKLKLNRV
jgi:hypothetical protein